MAVRRVTVVAQPQKSVIEKFSPVLVILLVVMAFGIGSLWTKVKYLESGTSGSNNNVAAGTGAQNPSGKYKTLTDVFKEYGKRAGLDTNKLVKCVDAGEKVAAVEKDYQDGAKMGVQGTPGFFVNGKFLGGAFPFEAFKELIDREIAGTGSDKYTEYKDTNLLQAGAGTQPAFIAVAKQVGIDGNLVKGTTNAKVTIVEYSDFQCPFCERGYQTVKQIMTTYGDKVRFVFKNFPLREIHPLAQKTSEAFECARDQGDDKAWKFHDALFETQQEWTSTSI